MFDDVEERLVFVATFRTHVEVFADERGDSLAVRAAFGFSLDEFVQPGVDAFAGHFLLARLFEDAQEFDHNLVAELWLGGEFMSDAIDQLFYVHSMDETPA